MKVALMFSGQGSQYPNMGLDFFEANLDKVKKAEAILGFDVLEALKNENDELKKTSYTQLLMTLMMTLIYDEIKDLVKVSGTLGFSLGEYSALYAAGIYDFETLLKLVLYRSSLMDEASRNYPGKMVAVLNANVSDLENIVSNLSSNYIITIANYNAKGQHVLSGEEKAIDLAIEAVKSLGVRRVVPLNVSGGFHSLLMDDASKKLNAYLKTLNKMEPHIPLYLNTTAKPLTINQLESELTKQIKSPVLFYQTIEQMINDGFTHFIEIGPGNVLTNLVKRNYDVNVINIENREDFKKLEEFLC